MTEIQVETTASVDGEVSFLQIPIRKGDRVTATLRVERPTESDKEEAWKKFFDLMDSSTMKSDGPYPSRSELHDRH